MRRLISIILFGLGLVSATVASAQPSTYNLFGFGLPRSTRSSHLLGMGGAAEGIIDARIVNDLNPASWSWLSRTRFEGDFRFGYTSAELGDLATKDHLFQFGGFAFASPIWEAKRMSIGLGVSPLTDATAQLKDSNALESRSYRSEGGMMVAYLGGSTELTNGVALGAKLAVIFGNVRRHSRIEFSTPTNAPGVFQRDFSASGLRPALGLSLRGDSLSPSLSGLGFGLRYSLPASLTAKRRSIITPVSSLLDTTIEVGGEGRYPGDLGVGISMKVGDRFRAAADIALQDFSDAYLFSDNGANPDPNLGSSTRIGVGFERLPNVNREFGFSSGFDRMGYRIGFNYVQTPVKTGFGGVNEMALTLGLGIPMTFESLIDLFAELGQRAPVTSGSGPTDMYFRVGATLSLSEKWFVPSRTDD